jgi:WD40 repeat protein
MPAETTTPKKPAAPQPTLEVGVDGALYAAAVDRFGGRVFVGGASGSVYAMELQATSPRLSPRGHVPSYIGALAITGAGTAHEQLVVGRYDGSLAWHDLHTGVKRHALAAHAGWLTDLDVVAADLAPGGKELLASVGHDMLVKTWDARHGTPRHFFAGHAAETPEGYMSALYAVAASPCEPLVASADRVGDVRIWDLKTEREATRFACPGFYTFDPEKRDRSIGGVRRVRFSPDGTKLAVAGIGAVSNVDGFVGPARIEVWDWRAGERLQVLEDKHQAVLNDVRWTSDGRRLIAGGGGDGGGLLISWSVEGNEKEPKPIRKIKLKGHPHRLHFIDSERSLVVTGFDGVQVWNTATLLTAESEVKG